MYILTNAVTINEAKDSSAIENIVTTHDDIYKVLTESGYKAENAKEVVDYRNAIWLGYEQMQKDRYINTNTIIKIQGTIEHNNAGIRKLPGTESKNSITGETIYTPPQNEQDRSKLPKIYSKELLESLFYEVYTKISYIEKACNVTRITATSYLNQLEEINLLESEKIGREKIYKNTRLIKLLSEN